MKTKERRERLQNKGFTLIELIVTIAIIAIFSGVVLTFISTGSNIYRSTSSSAKVQMETQETFDQIEDLIIDVNRSLYYANGSGDSLQAEALSAVRPRLTDKAVVYVESDREISEEKLQDQGFASVRRGRAGAVFYLLAQKNFR